MAGEMDINVFSNNVSSVGASASIPIFKVADQGGDITILDAQITGTTAGTPVGLLLVTYTDAAAPALSGTIGAWAGTITMGAGTVFEATISSPVVSCGQWIGLKNTSGTTPAVSFLTVSYVVGK